MYFKEQKIIFILSIITQNWDGSGSENFATWKTTTHLSCIVNNVAVDDLAT